MITTEKVHAACNSAVEQLGYDLVKVQFETEFGTLDIVLYIKAKNGEPITHKDCEKVSLAVDEIIENLDPTEGDTPYSISVSSLGHRSIEGENTL